MRTVNRITIGALILGLFACGKEPPPIVKRESATTTESQAVASTDLDRAIDKAAQSSVRLAITVAKVIALDNQGSYAQVNRGSMTAVDASVSYANPSTNYAEVSFDVRGHGSTIALASLAQGSGLCFGLLDANTPGGPTYSHSDGSQTACDATDVPYSSAGW